MPCRVIGNAAARSVAVAGPPSASAARMARRLGSARAANTASATASDASSAMEIGDQLVELVDPALGVSAERLVVRLRLELGEPGLDDGHRGAVSGRRERKLDVRAAGIVLGQSVDAPRVPEDRLRLDPLDPQLRDIAAVPGQPCGAADPQVDFRAIAEPGAEAFRRRDGGPDPVHRTLDVDGALDSI